MIEGLTEFTAGDTLKGTATATGYSAADGWTLSYVLQHPTLPKVTILGTPNGAAWDLLVAAAATAAWPPGTRDWFKVVTKGAESYLVGSGRLVVKPDPRSVTNLDARSHARRTLEAIEAVIEKRATVDQEEYTINGRQLKRMPLADLLRFRDVYRSEVRAEDVAAGLVQGEKSRSRVLVRI